MRGGVLQKQTKICLVCKKSFNNRKRWDSRGQWEKIIYCSDACRKNKNK